MPTLSLLLLYTLTGTHVARVRFSVTNTLLLRVAVDQTRLVLVSVDSGRFVATHKRSCVRISRTELFLEMLMLTKIFQYVSVEHTVRSSCTDF